MRFFLLNRYRLFLIIFLIFVILAGTFFYRTNESRSIPAWLGEKEYLYASGDIVGIYEQTQGVLVVDTAKVVDKMGNEVSPAKGRIKAGDYIYSINGEAVLNKEDMIKLISECDEKELLVSFSRKGIKHNVKIKPAACAQGKYAIGLWVKDDMAGIGTMTCFDESGNFVALGHGIGNGTNGDLLSVNKGYLYDIDLKGITKGKKGQPGEVDGIIYYGANNCLGKLTGNSNIGIYGEVNTAALATMKNISIKYELADLSEIKKGKAYLLSEISGEIEEYEIEIKDIYKWTDEENKQIYFEVTDKNLLKKTGGIVQGMSGSPIIQDGKLIGAVTHVLVDNPAKGYGIYIKNML